MKQEIKEHTVYWIRRSEQSDIYLEGYIGITNNLKKRWKRHRVYSEPRDKKKNKQPLYQAFQKYGIENFEFDIVISKIDKWTAFNLEYALRPHGNIGYNRGCGGSFSSPVRCSTLSPLRDLDGHRQRIQYFIDKTRNKISNKTIKA